MSTRKKIALTIVVVFGVVGYMIYSTVRSGSALTTFKHVNEVMANPHPWLKKRLQLHGHVVAESILKKRGSLDYIFAIYHQNHWVEVTYRGIVPDSFRDCADIVVTGMLLDASTFAAEEISAKCPSKYDGQRARQCGEALRDKILAHRR